MKSCLPNLLEIFRDVICKIEKGGTMDVDVVHLESEEPINKVLRGSPESQMGFVDI